MTNSTVPCCQNLGEAVKAALPEVDFRGFLLESGAVHFSVPLGDEERNIWAAITDAPEQEGYVAEVTVSRGYYGKHTTLFVSDWAESEDEYARPEVIRKMVAAITDAAK